MKKLLTLFCTVLLSQISHAQTQLWGTAAYGGTYGVGTIVQGDSDGTNFHTVYSFTDSIGAYPVGRMAMASNHKIYMVTELGGDSGSCTICSFDPATQSIATVYNFAVLPQYGDVPQTGLILASNGKLYGTTAGGGLYSYGVIYSFDPSDNSYVDVYDFDSIAGYAPGMELLQANDGKLYGITLGTPYNSLGNSALFSFDPSNNSFAKLYAFPSGYGNSSNPALIQATDNKIYGLVDDDTSDSSILFSYNINTSVCSILQGLNYQVIGLPVSGMVQAANGKLYGTTTQQIGNAVIYSYDISSGNFNTVLVLDSATGFYPEANIGILGSGKLVFSTIDGGIKHQGALVSFDVTSNTYTIMLSFDSATTGEQPQCDILEARIGPTGIIAVPDIKLDIYPNPALDKIYLNNTQPNTPYTVTNMLGESLIKGMAGDGTQAIDISTLPDGMYFINQVKFVKE